MIQPNIPAPSELLSLRRTANENHHIWNNNGTWWAHYTVYLPDYTARRVRRSLRTHDVAEARRRRDALLAGIPSAR